MKKMILSLVAALAVGGALAATAADAQRTVVRTTHTRVIHHRIVHRVARNHHRVCKTAWRHHKRVRTCRTW